MRWMGLIASTRGLGCRREGPGVVVRAPTPGEVLHTVTVATGIARGEMEHPAGRRRKMEARKVAYRLLHDDAHLSWEEVARLMHVRYGGSIVTAADNADVELVDRCRRLLENGART